MDHPATLSSADSLATDLAQLAVDLAGLGELRRARDLFEDTLRRRRSTLGDDHPDTRATADALAETERGLAT